MEVTALVGEDRGLARAALQSLVEAEGVSWDSPDLVMMDGRHRGLEEALETLRHPPWTARRRLAVLWDLPLTTASGDLAPLTALGADPEEGWLILWAPEADRRLSAVKSLEARGAVRRVDRMKPREAVAALKSLAAKEGGSFEEPAAAMVVQTVGTDFAALEQEAGKLLAFTDGREVTPDDVARATTGRPDVSVFRLTEAVAGKRPGESLRLLGQLLGAGESAIGLLALLAREFRLVGKAKMLMSEGKPLTSLGLPTFVLRRLGKDADRWTAEEIRRAFRCLLETDRQLKVGGRPLLCLELFVMDVVG